ncbi:MAG: helix-hairpin-helix domain-containing protein [Methanobacterium sp.]
MEGTSKSNLWKLTHSLWILGTLPLGFLSWASFIYIGIRVRQMKWIISGLIYSSSIITAMLIGSDPSYLINVPEDSWLMNIQILYFFGLWLCSMIHAFWVRNEYLLRLEAISEPKIKDNDYLKEKYAKEYHRNKEENAIKSQDPFEGSSIGEEIKKEHVKDVESTSKYVNINNDPEEVIAELPGVGLILAKQAVEIRKSHPFQSVYDFGEALGLKPHIIERIKPLVATCNEVPVDEELETSASGRLVDY